MKQAVFILGFIFNMGYVMEALHFPISGFSLVFLFVAIVLTFITKPADVKVPVSYVIFMLLFLLYYLVSYFFFSKNEYASYKFFMVFAKIPALTVIPFYLKKGYKSFFWGYVASLILLTLILSVQSGTSLSAESPTVSSRLEAGSLNPIWISRLVLEAVMLSALVLRVGKTKLFLLILFCLPVIYSSGSKGPILACAFAWFLHNFKWKEKSGLKIALIILLLVPVGFIGYRVLTSLDPNSYFVQRFMRVVPDESADEIVEESRAVVWPQTVQKISDEGIIPLLFGNGIGNYPRFYYGYFMNDRVYPHNFFLEMIVEQGLLFSLFVLIAIIYFYRRSKNSFKYLFLYFFLNAMFSGDIILNERVFFYLSFAAMHKSFLNESIVSNIRKLSKSGYNKITGYKPV
jgi:hypothetical protein